MSCLELRKKRESKLDRFKESEVKFLEKLYIQTITKCKKCRYGWINHDEVDYEECECRKIFIYLKELLYANIPQEYWNLELNKLEIYPMLILKNVEKYLSHFSSAVSSGLSFAFLGENGIGKTSLLAEIGKVAILKELDVVYLTAQEYINYKMLHNDDMLERIEEKSDVILMDELDKPYKKAGSDYVITQLENFFRSTLPKNKMVHIACNSTEEEIRKKLGKSVFSIMNRKMRFLTLEGEDLGKDISRDWDRKLEGETTNYLNKYLVKIAAKMERFKNDRCI